MRNFVLGVVVTLVVLGAVAAATLFLGYIPSNADAEAPPLERHLAMSALDASMEHSAPRVNNPIPPTDENLIIGMKLYTMNCSSCHGTLDLKPSPLEKSFYPTPPQLILDPIDDPEWHVFYAIRTGVRYSGMPAWNKVLSEPDMWKLTSFLTNIQKLPPAVQDYWKQSFGVTPPAASSAGEPEMKEHKD
ncbi:MAG: cytochrome c [Acidobacteriales bacterium]|nr:cytochrome c [Terriglobales bacterium]